MTPWRCVQEGGKHLQPPLRQPRKRDPKETAKQSRAYLHSTGCERHSGSKACGLLLVYSTRAQKAEHCIASSEINRITSWDGFSTQLCCCCRLANCLHQKQGQHSSNFTEKMDIYIYIFGDYQRGNFDKCRLKCNVSFCLPQK